MFDEHPIVTLGLGALAGAAIAGTGVGALIGAGAGAAILGISTCARRAWRPAPPNFGGESDPFDLAVFGPSDEGDLDGISGRPHDDARLVLFGDDAADAGQTPSGDAGGGSDGSGGSSGGGGSGGGGSGGGDSGGGGGGGSGGGDSDGGDPSQQPPQQQPKQKGPRPAPPTGSTRQAHPKYTPHKRHR